MMLQIFDFDHLLAYTTGILLIAGLVLLFYNRLYVFREKEEQMNNQSQNKRLALILQTGNLQLWLYMPQTRRYMTLSEEGKVLAEFNPVDFSQRFNRDDFDVMQRDIFDMCDGKRRDAELRMHSHATGDDERTYDVKISVLQRDARRNIVMLLGVQRSKNRCVVPMPF